MESQYQLIEQRLEILPWYITEFIEYKGRKGSEHSFPAKLAENSKGIKKLKRIFINVRNVKDTLI